LPLRARRWIEAISLLSRLRLDLPDHSSYISAIGSALVATQQLGQFVMNRLSR
jgi:hypothetical protein